MKIDRTTLERLGRLSRLRIAEEEAPGLLRDLEEILAYVERLEGVETEHTTPLVHAREEPGRFREDRSSAGTDAAQLLEAASHVVAGHFAVPPVLPVEAEVERIEDTET